MQVGIVKLQLKNKNIASFERLFAAKQKKIRNFRGFECLAIYKDRNVAGLYVTYSHWDMEGSLQHGHDSGILGKEWVMHVLETNN